MSHVYSRVSNRDKVLPNVCHMSIVESSIDRDKVLPNVCHMSIVESPIEIRFYLTYVTCL